MEQNLQDNNNEKKQNYINPIKSRFSSETQPIYHLPQIKSEFDPQSQAKATFWRRSVMWYLQEKQPHCHMNSLGHSNPNYELFGYIHLTANQIIYAKLYASFDYSIFVSHMMSASFFHTRFSIWLGEKGTPELGNE